MRRFIILATLFIFILVIVIPTLIVNNFKIFAPRIEVDSKEMKITVLFHETGEIKVMPLEEYLVGVVAAEMPAEFEMEALKAQAVAARTYTLKKLDLKAKKVDSSHPEAIVCTDPNHCQAWMSEEELKKRWGLLKYVKYRKKIEEAVTATKGQIITYEGRLIDPVYHSTCGGRTENSEEVWKYKIPYLRSVECPYDEDSPRYKEVKVFSMQQLDSVLGTDLVAVPASTIRDKVASYFRILQKTSTGRIKKLYIGGKTILATELRFALGLRSTRFSMSISEDKVKFTTYGNGHGVGMCQYGANGFAKHGKNYIEILKHYYTGVEIKEYK
ncbi:MAG: stage sporulation protein [Clostridia bacterium]|jgi:stage II sporulation protein D|nr:sporulation protein [Clostridiales bacterium]MDK2985080.1 stage sporulation protein [Clostridia bacterium]